MRRLLRQLTSVSLVASLLAWFPSGATGSVVCFEPDGSVRLEAGVSCCAPGDAASVGEQRTDRVTEDECGACFDVQLGGPTGHLATSVARVSPPLLAVLAPDAACFPARPSSRAAATRARAERTPASPQRPTVLPN